METETADKEDTFAERAYQVRGKLRELAMEVKALQEHPIFLMEQKEIGQHSEMHANVTLAYRHLEDATMRLGKAVQAYDGGTSVYPR